MACTQLIPLGAVETHPLPRSAGHGSSSDKNMDLVRSHGSVMIQENSTRGYKWVELKGNLPETIDFPMKIMGLSSSIFP